MKIVPVLQIRNIFIVQFFGRFLDPLSRNSRQNWQFPWFDDLDRIFQNGKFINKFRNRMKNFGDLIRMIFDVSRLFGSCGKVLIFNLMAQMFKILGK